ncbi:PAS domain S-box protein [Geomonas sp. RF6]|uniref:PAS domain S-box protein n=1 Tax=Geomonas sp. RF6 TaxID=2897342 RepID=UPI001E4759C5|nr:cache domain-containing protein [Geomonas sp. RF6]UFS71420.1 PAS domain S-box protein [Geomonas sp. RF6]
MSRNFKNIPELQFSRSAFLLRLIAITLLINLFVIGIAAWSLRHSWLDNHERTVVSTENISLVLEKYLSGTIAKVDLMLMDLKENAEAQLAGGRIDEQRLNKHMSHQLGLLPELDGVGLHDRRGNVLYGTGLPAGRQVNIADRDYFQVLRKAPKTGLVISPPVMGKISGKWVVIIARALEGPDGSFGGVVFGAFALDHFTALFSNIDVGRQGTIMLRDEKMRVIARSIGKDASWALVGRHDTAPELTELLKEGRSSGTYYATSPLDNINRITSFRKVDGYPIFVFVAKSKNEAFAQWREDAAKVVGVVTTFTCLSLFYAYQFFVRRIREKEAEAELRLHHHYLEDLVKERTSELESRNRELEASEGLLRSVFENICDGIVIHDSQGRIVHANEQWLKMLQITREEATNLTIADVSDDPPPQEELTKLWESVIAGDTRFFEWRTRRPHDGSVFDAEVFICPFTSRGRQLVMGSVRDITERKKVEQELSKHRDHLELLVMERTEELAKAVEETRRETEQRIGVVEELRRKDQLLIQQSRLAAMGEMMGNIAHQWRQPLNVLGLVIQELKLSYEVGIFDEELLSASVSKAMNVIEHMSQTIDDFRYLLDSDKRRVRFSVNDVVQRVISMVEPRSKIEIIAEKECMIDGMRNEYWQVLINIINNSNDAFCERNIQDPRITIHIESENDRCIVTISDNAGGIPDGIIEKVFDPYFTTKGPDKGTGIGLFMSKTIIEQSMKGTLTVRNTAEGAEFKIEV